MAPASPCGPRREELEDWALFSLRDEASATGGCSWLMASPMSCGCSPQGSVKVLGAVVVSGRGSKACIDSAWLQHWSCYLGKTIMRVSVQVMEVRRSQCAARGTSSIGQRG